MRPGDLVTVLVTGVGNGGVCIARYDGQVVFLRGALPGERVTARVTQANSKFLRAQVVEVLEASEHRVEPPCRYASMCGGCDWQHVAVDHQRVLKADVVREQMSHLGGVQDEAMWEVFRVQALEPDALRWRTRNKFQRASPDSLGMFQSRSKVLVEIEDCLLAMPGATTVARDALPYVQGDVAVVSAADGTHVVVDGRGGPIMTEQVKDRTFRIHASSFWQVHRQASASLVDHVVGLCGLQRGQSAFDLYSGAGLFAAFLAEEVGEQGSVVAVESGIDAVRDARRSLSDLAHVELVTSDVGQWVARRREGCDVVVLDPPRAGAGSQVIADVARLARSRIVYVACEPSALARDTALLASHGWQLRDLVGIDAFPMTSHVECVAMFTTRD